MEINFMWVVKVLVVAIIFNGLLVFVFRKVMLDSTEGAVNRLNRETDEVREKQVVLNDKIKAAEEELAKRRKEADALVAKMKEEAAEKAKTERESILKKAREDGEEIIAKAQRTKEDMRKVVEKEMEMKTVDFTGIILREILSEKAIGALNECLITDFLKGLENVDMAMISAEIDTAEVVTSEPLTDKLKAELQAILKKKLERDVEIDAKVDKEIISGILVKFGSLSLNGGLKSMLMDKSVEVKDRIEKGLM